MTTKIGGNCQRRLTTEDFVIRARTIHGNRYGYSKTRYVNFHSKVVVTCLIHGDFTTRPSSHLSKGCGCSKCGYLATGAALTDTVTEFLRKARNTHGEFYDYQLAVSDFVNAHTPIRITCRLHGVFTQVPSKHVSGQGCVKCGDLSTGKCSTTSFEIVLEKCKRKHGGKYTYLTQPDAYKNTRTSLSIVCAKHGVFKQTAKDHLRGSGCPVCSTSHGEEKINLWLQDRNLTFSRQKRFLDCKDKRQLPYDFCVVCEGEIYLIEYHGEQHYSPTRFSGISQEKAEASLVSVRRRDEIKMKYATDKQIPLLVIPYWDFDNVDDLLVQFFPP